jgi:hypothetical protein
MPNSRRTRAARAIPGGPINRLSPAVGNATAIASRAARPARPQNDPDRAPTRVSTVKATVRPPSAANVAVAARRGAEQQARQSPRIVVGQWAQVLHAGRPGALQRR